jgi:hypothetical protein
MIEQKIQYENLLCSGALQNPSYHCIRSHSVGWGKGGQLQDLEKKQRQTHPKETKQG